MCNSTIAKSFFLHLIFTVLGCVGLLSEAFASPTRITAHVNVHPLYLEESQDSDYVFSSTRDEEGYLWLATDNGVKRYDGYEFKRYIQSDLQDRTIPSNKITNLLLQTNGQLWAAGRNLSLFQPKTETFKQFNLTNNAQINSVIEGSNGILWLGGQGFGLIGFDSAAKEQVFSSSDDSPTFDIFALAQRAFRPELWVATRSNLFVFNTETHRLEAVESTRNDSFKLSNIRGLAEDTKGNVWIIRSKELILYRPEDQSFKSYQLSSSLSDSNQSITLTSVLVDHNNHVWIGTAKSGVFKFVIEQNLIEHFPSTRSDLLRLPESQVEHMQEDQLGNLWLAAGESGLYRISEHLEKFVTRQSGFNTNYGKHYLSHNKIVGLVEGDDEDIWIATDGGGINRYNQYQKVFKHYPEKGSGAADSCDNDLTAIEKSPDGKIWTATRSNKLCFFDFSSNSLSRYAFGNSHRLSTPTLGDITILHASDDQNMFIGSRSRGFFILNTQTGKTRAYPPSSETEIGSKNRSVYAFFPYEKNTYWIGGDGGLDLFDLSTGSFTSVQLPSAVGIHDIHQDEYGSLWLSTTGGLVSFHPKTLVSLEFNKKDGLIDDFVLGLEEDERRNLWLSTRHGLSRFSMQSHEFTSYTDKDGLAGSRFNLNAHLTTANGYMYFGGPQGLSIFKPNHLPSNEHAPNVHLKDIEVIGNSQSSYIPYASFKHMFGTDPIKLHHHQNELVFEFSASSFISPSQNRYKYRLIGLEDEWIDATSKQRRVRYTNLSPGVYTFQVLGSNNEGVWAGKAKQINLEVLPAWWQSWWSKVLLLGALVGLAQAFSFWRLRVTKARKEELEYIIQERTQELDTANKAVVKLNTELEQRVMHRTRELSIEIEERKNAEERTSHQALHDPLTGLPNRSWLLEHLQTLLDQAQTKNFKFAVLFIGGDRFKQINDTHGHLLGDMLLVAAAKRLQSILPSHYHCVRLGSDEFTVVLDEVSGEKQTEEIANTILTAFDTPFVFEQAKMKFSVSIGLLVGDNEYQQPAQVLRNADIAMNHAKNKGRGIYQAFDQGILEQTLDYASLQADLQQALRKSEFELVYQPIIELQDESISGFEALLRWNHPTRGYVPPDQFIPIAEDLGIIFEIGLWVLDKACQQLKAWDTDLTLDILPSIAVNLSALQLKQADLISRCDQIFDSIGDLRKKIKLEITESALMENTAAVDQLLESFRERGIELAIDDFGTGYSSLSYLDKLPVQVLKIDRSFVSALYPEEGEKGNAHEIVRATIGLAHNLNMRVVAEGIETEKELSILKQYSCDFGQGYLIARPLKPEAATEFLVSKTKS